MQLCCGRVVQKVGQPQLARRVHKASDDQRLDPNQPGMYVCTCTCICMSATYMYVCINTGVLIAVIFKAMNFI